MIRKLLKSFQHCTLLLARCGIGALLIMRGWHRWFTTGIGRQEQILAEHGIPAADFLAWATTMFEIVGGALLVAGLGTRIVGLGVLAMQLVLLVDRFGAGFIARDGGYELHLALAVAALIFVAFGSGKLGADALFFTPRVVEVELPPPKPPRESERTLYSQEPHS